MIGTQIEELVSEKRLQFQSRVGIQIGAKLTRPSYGLFVTLQLIEFKRLLSNLVNNSVEAIEGAGRVLLESLVR